MVNNTQLSILIPVFNSPHCVHDLLLTLNRNTQPDCVKEVLIGDDGSDELTRSLLADFQAHTHLPVRIITHAENVGYLNNANQLYAAASAEIVVFLNTDTLLPCGWLQRVRDAMQQSNVALATPFTTNAPNLTILPNHGQTWADVDRCLAALPPKYPDAQTAVGFCLAVRKDRFGAGELFDEVYALGYGEETDLHYRAVAKGWRSVVIDNLLVYHAKGSSSFTEKFGARGRDQLLEKNSQIFFGRWGALHHAREKDYLQKQPYEHLRQGSYFSLREKNQPIDVLFLLPGLVEKVGGIEVVVDFAKNLTMQGLHPAVYSFGRVDELYVNNLGLLNPFRQTDEIYASVSSIRMVIATSYDSVVYAREIAAHYQAKLVYLVQGPETLFNYGKDFQVVCSDYQDANLELWCCSKFLQAYLREYTTKSVSYIPMGPDLYQFYPAQEGQKRQPKSIAACLRYGDAKGSGVLLHALFLAKKAGFTIYLFGKESYFFNLPSDIFQQLGDLSRRELRQLFNQVEFYLDLSYFEGLGLLPLEALMCGAIPIVSHNGGSDYIFTDKKDALFLNNILLDSDFFNRLAKMPGAELDAMRLAAGQVKLTVSKQLANEAFYHYVQSYLQIDPSTSEQVAPMAIAKASAPQPIELVSKKSWIYTILRKVYVRYQSQVHAMFDRIVNKASRKLAQDIHFVQQRLDKQQEALDKILASLKDKAL